MIERIRSFLRYVVVILLCFALVLAFLCPILDLAKINIFKEVGSPYTLNLHIEYSYLVISLITPYWIFLAVMCRCWYKVDFTMKGIEFKLLYWILTWLAISTLYTLFTRDDIDDVPFNCPSDYSYPNHRYQLACQIREANFLAMWIFGGIGILLTIFIPAGVFPLSEEEREKNPKIDFYYVWSGYHRI
ncbi:hypothetical protein Glove_535g32 [Diversispora epigaea]|uniref:MARVEL domain-containing protein n=1 Tax=Diversispora epigaea TaxID=1348612 RepID=A0A397GIV7_9GLOM|nr:hypothetical protein Glove_535g32 [Diversispora epigaea]